MTQETTPKVKFGAVKTAQIEVNNSTDTERDYDVEAMVQVNGTSVDNFVDGMVKATDEPHTVKATWYRYSPTNTTVNYVTDDPDEMCAISNIINQFCQNVTATDITSKFTI